MIGKRMIDPLPRIYLSGKPATESRWRMSLQPDLDLTQRLEEELFRQTVRGSPEAVSMLLADDFIEFGRSGAVYRKEEVVQDLAAESHEANPPVRTALDFELFHQGTPSQP